MTLNHDAFFQTFQFRVFVDDPDDRSLTQAGFSGYFTRCVEARSSDSMRGHVRVLMFRAGFKGAQGARAPGLPPTEGLPPNPSYFICRSR